MSKVTIIKLADGGHLVADNSNYIYMSEDVARAFARDKWGDENPTIAVEVRSSATGTDRKQG